jgi:DnaJ-class molecular chaperone
MADSYYEILGVPKSAGEKDIRSAYRRLARKFHPDVNPGKASASDRFKKINEAYEVLSDTRTRRDYDEFGPDWKHAGDLRNAGVGAAGGRPQDFGFFSRRRPGQSDVADIFQMFDFVRAGAGQPESQTGGQASASARELPVEVTLDEAYAGTSRLVTLERGRGRPTRLEVKVPPGIADGGRVRIHLEDGSEIQLVVSVHPDPRFRRDGADLYVDVPVELADLMLGGEAATPAMTGRIALKIPAGTQNGRRFRIAGKGMPKLGTPSQFGDLYATVKAVLPEALSDDERRLFERLRELRPGAGRRVGRAGKGDPR